jgi:maltooligosyltrehalose trehalohydrolase
MLDHPAIFISHASEDGEEEQADPAHRAFLTLYTDLLRLRRTHPALRHRDRQSFAAEAVGEQCIAIRRQDASGAATVLVIANLRDRVEVDLNRHPLTRTAGGRSWQPLLDTEDRRYGGRARSRLRGPVCEFQGAGCIALELSEKTAG